ncbi:hypothetical protein FOZ61_006409 [Perkinsus olseni]|uniref:P-type Ca(2+) transporter n=2 Tax=Perkinsus olseni TaxID=32597 RepID=A0A7J6LPW3_PEROL|nr:hypothetical protein FOZ61_006409 [Perkinsus olseni]KAF4661060.1 hypothetical protein FOL46_005869 [Perkinsus olseni]
MTSTRSSAKSNRKGKLDDTSIRAIAYARDYQEALDFFNVSVEKGLTESQVEAQSKKYGPNELDKTEGKSMIALILEQFDDLMVKILLVAAFISFLLAYFDDENNDEGMLAYVEPLVILLILIANAIVGVWQETNAEAALEALKSLQPAHAHVLRNGSWVTLDSAALVPGDIVEVRVGDKVPADIRLCKLRTTTLRVEQSQLTGESVAVSKDVDAVPDDDEGSCEVQGKTNMLFSSTAVANGCGVGVVVGTAMNTEIGEIQKAVADAAEEDQQTPLQMRLEEFSELLAKIIFAICFVVWIINYKHFFDPVYGSWFRGCIYYFKVAVALAVAAIPEGLPAVITTCLALGTRRMAKRNCIVRRLPSVQTLGCTTVICSDKTGTLTTNEMCAVKFAVPSSSSSAGVLNTYNVDGVSYTPVGEIRPSLPPPTSNTTGLAEFAKCAAMCNQSRLRYSNEPGDDEDVDDDTETDTENGDATKKPKIRRTGEPTEAAIRVLAEKIGCPDKALNRRCLQSEDRSAKDLQAFSHYWANLCSPVATLEFTRDRKSMSIIVKEKDRSENTLYVKGAPEVILDRCTTIMMPDGSVKPLDKKMKNIIFDDYVEKMAGEEALRTLGLAVRKQLDPRIAHFKGIDDDSKNGSLLKDPANFIKVEQELTFLGLVGLMDPPRPECRPAIDSCREAGISVVMITGDNKLTAEAIAKDLGIISPGKNAVSLTGREFDQLSDSDKTAVLRRCMDEQGGVFSRTEPRHKQVIVRILRTLGEVTAMTGDGVNDAPALKAADIGIAMGISGTEVAKEASDMVLTDDNFSTIVAAVEEGRSIYSNMKAFIRYLISSNIGEVASIFFTAALGIPESLTPVQLLWVNLVTDGPPATALGFNPPDLDVMKRPPRKSDDKLISGWVFFRYCVIGMYVGLATVGIFIYYFVLDEGAADGHTTVTLWQLMHWDQCHAWGDSFTANHLEGMIPGDACSYFTYGKAKASTFSLTVLVVIEMFNALNALSEDGSLLQLPPWCNPWLCLAVTNSIGIHMVILYQPFLASIFGVVPLDIHDWALVLYFSFPVILIDEVMKTFGRIVVDRQIEAMHVHQAELRQEEEYAQRGNTEKME